MTTLSTLTKAQLVTLVEQHEAQVQDLTDANTALLEATMDLGQTDTQSSVAADMMMTGVLRSCIQATRKDGTPVDGLYKFWVETSVSYTDGKNADDNYVWNRVSNYKSAMFTCDQVIADQLLELLEVNDFVVIRNWYRYATSAKNVIDVKQLDFKTKAVRLDENGHPLMRKGLQYPADLKCLQIDVITSKPKADEVDHNTDDSDLF